MRLNEKRALITGGAQGIGFTIAETFCREGAAVYLADINEDLGQSAVLKLKEKGYNATFVFLDVSDDANWQQVCKRIDEETGGLDILVAEDNPINQKVVSKILERAGHQVDLVVNGQLALEELEHKEYDLTVLDMQMPVMGGVDAIKMFRFAHVDSNMPFIMLTANATVQAVKECEDVGVDAFVTKPFQARKLIDTIDQVAGQYKIVPSVVEKLPVESVEKEKPSTDLTKLAELASLSHDSRFLEELVFSFLQDGARLIGEMKDALGLGEILRMKEVAHAFKGSAASLGATRLYETGIKLSDLSVAGFREEGKVLLDQADNEFSLVSEELRTYIEQHRTESVH